ncbi:MAG: DUF2939 domain-containing protein [Methylobacteriaceae bacterium]|nr:DUF2939 domain-containing protein [Methylobacteriaceae bacterium]
MRWIVGAALALVLAWTAYLGSPYLAAYRFAQAVRAGDVEEIAARTNFHAIRLSIAKQLVAAGLEASDLDRALGSGELQAAAGALVVTADPALGTLGSARGVLQLARDAEVGVGARTGLGGGAPDVRGALAFLGSSRWRGFRNVYFALPPERASAQQARLQFRLSRLSWRLVSIDLPDELKRQLVERIGRFKALRR